MERMGVMERMGRSESICNGWERGEERGGTTGGGKAGGGEGGGGEGDE